MWKNFDQQSFGNIIISWNVTNKTVILIFSASHITLIFIFPRLIEKHNHECTIGVVTHLAQNNMTGLQNRSYTHHYPVITYTVNDSLYWHLINNEILLTKYEVGDSVKIIYELSHPEKSKILSVTGYWFPVPKMMIAMLLLMMVYGIWKVIFPGTRSKRNTNA